MEVGIINLKKILQRIYSDFLLPSRLEEYKGLIIQALKNGYNVISVEQFYETFVEGRKGRGSKYLVLRHDIDTDIITAKQIFEIERHLQVYSSFYFRLATIDIPFMRTIRQYGSEASYHYEELASYAKKHKIRHPDKIHSNIMEIRELFSRNLCALRRSTGIPMEIVASHGDFVNRYLGITNCAVLKDPVFRKKNKIKLEVYDDTIMKYVDSRHSDCGYPSFWKPNSPLEAINSNIPVIYVLTHPRHWRANIKENIRDNCIRLIEGVKYRLPFVF